MELSAENDARVYLHLQTDPDTGVGEARGPKVRIFMDHVDAWRPVHSHRTSR